MKKAMLILALLVAGVTSSWLGAFHWGGYRSGYGGCYGCSYDDDCC